ncbi:uncharacterized protein LOC125354239 [Perognathus longimembris pacificus]|uniref:uncharacterized protein LOC125354239 n=1 Tax=Perognathus longimembris pacificus TaxID=214514 RepID=UPI002018EA6C|nr:uncharacterized protein LOC125354239 [Perognathus longimembris pacificus]XP_048205800.1 uncharacterized protein LOC125354239 [Perognathus longimembris pacificus]XP_048205801.1 uncharacterized protein LOC125354239 [Perognathus longimembris pacificus]
MSRRQMNSSNNYSYCANHPHSASFSPRVPGGSPNSSLNTYKGLRTRIPSNSEFGSHSEWYPPSSRMPLGKGCTHSKGTDTSHLVKVPTVARRAPCHPGGPRCMLYTDGPSHSSSPTFLDQLIKGINYLDRSTGIFSNNQSAQALSLPRLAASYLERAANALYLDNLENSTPHSCPSRSIGVGPDRSSDSTSMVPSARPNATLQYLGDSTNVGSQQPPLRPEGMSQKSDIKLPELRLISNGLLSLSRLPKLWEAMRSSINASEPITKPPNWW